jgi:predicted nucleic acid-binding protein
LLLWAGETPLQQAAKLRPTFPSYVSSLSGRHGEALLASVTQKKIIEAGKQFFIWGKQNHPKDFGSLSSSWLESLRPARVRDTSDEHEHVSLYEALLVNFPNLDIVDLDRDVIHQAARLRAEYRIRPPDALQAGACLLYGSDVFITNDGLLKRLQDKLEVIILDECVDGA